jgi:hypothetical protein
MEQRVLKLGEVKPNNGVMEYQGKGRLSRTPMRISVIIREICSRHVAQGLVS